MPRKKVKAVDGVDGRVSTLRELGEALGVRSANTMTHWKKKGLPAGPPWSVVECYRWAKGLGLRVQLPRDPELSRLCRSASDRVAERAAARPAPEPAASPLAPLPAGGGAAGLVTWQSDSLPDDDVGAVADPGVPVPSSHLEDYDGNEVHRSMAWKNYEAARKGALDNAKARRDLISREEVGRLREAMSQAALSCFVDLRSEVMGRLRERLPELDEDQLKAVGQVVDGVVHQGRERMAGAGQRELRSLLRRPTAAERRAVLAQDDSPGDDVA